MNELPWFLRKIDDFVTVVIIKGVPHIFEHKNEGQSTTYGDKPISMDNMKVWLGWAGKDSESS